MRVMVTMARQDRRDWCRWRAAKTSFLAYVRKPATPGMPSFAAVPEPQLRDVYAYIRSIPQAAPAPDSVPLIKGILDRRTKAN